MPTFLGVETEKKLLGTQKILVDKIEWQIRYHKKLRIIYGLHNMIKYFGLKELDSIFFSFSVNGELTGRVFKMEGTELTSYRPERSCRMKSNEGCLIFEDSVPRRNSGISL